MDEAPTQSVQKSPFRIVAARLFNIATYCSAGMIFVIIFAWLCAVRIDPRIHFIPLFDGWCISVHGHDLDRRVVVFNDPNYGPYQGSILGVSGSSVPLVSSFGDKFGIYIRSIWWPNGIHTPFWTFDLSLVYPLMAAFILPIIWLARSRNTNRGFPIEPVSENVTRSD